jgi:hypothetical protein
VVQKGSERELVLLVRGNDEYGHFEIVSPPESDGVCGESAVHTDALRRKSRNIMPIDPTT